MQRDTVATPTSNVSTTTKLPSSHRLVVPGFGVHRSLRAQLSKNDLGSTTILTVKRAGPVSSLLGVYLGYLKPTEFLTHHRSRGLASHKLRTTSLDNLPRHIQSLARTAVPIMEWPTNFYRQPARGGFQRATRCDACMVRAPRGRFLWD